MSRTSIEGRFQTFDKFFKLYALDSMTGLKPGVEKAGLLKAMEGHLLGQAELIGRYKRR